MPSVACGGSPTCLRLGEELKGGRPSLSCLPFLIGDGRKFNARQPSRRQGRSRGSGIVRAGKEKVDSRWKHGGEIVVDDTLGRQVGNAVIPSECPALFDQQQCFGRKLACQPRCERVRSYV